MGVALYMIPNEGLQGIPLRVIKVRWVRQSALEIVGI
jgi:hypothetical protein